MSEHEFDSRLKLLEEQARAIQDFVDAYCDQELARLFYESGWTQNRIAEKFRRSRLLWDRWD
jgi:hypothetical protein